MLYRMLHASMLVLARAWPCGACARAVGVVYVLGRMACAGRVRAVMCSPYSQVADTNARCPLFTFFGRNTNKRVLSDFTLFRTKH